MSKREVTVKQCDYCGSIALGHPLVDCIHNLRDTIDTVRKERDSARVNLDAIALAVGFPRTYDASMLPSKVEHIVEQVWTAERERDEARAAIGTLRELVGCRSRNVGDVDMPTHTREIMEAVRHRTERAEAEAAYIRRAFRGAVESDALAVTYKTVGSYRAGLLKTINALDAAEAP